mgnify:CR=1 FL=1
MEERQVKIHLGCGQIYLDPADDWTNIDIAIPGYSFLAKDRPDLVQSNRTTLDRYYAHPYRRDAIVTDRLCVADVFMDARSLEIPSNSVEEILVVQLLEHFSRVEAADALIEWYRVLQPGGRLVVDTPKLDGLMLEFLAEKSENRREYYYRMIFGSQKNAGAYHKDGYTLAKLSELMQSVGFEGIRDLGNPLGHPYPALTVEGRKL